VGPRVAWLRRDAGHGRNVPVLVVLGSETALCLERGAWDGSAVPFALGWDDFLVGNGSLVRASRSGRLALVVGTCAVLLLLSGCGGSGAGRTTASSLPVAPVSEPVRYLPGGLAVVAHSSIPGGSALQIRAKHYSFEGRVYFDLVDWVRRPDGSSGGGDWRPEGHAPFAFTFDGDCARAGVNATVILYGLLRQTADTATAYTARGPHTLRTAAIPARLRPGGIAAYTVLGELPERIVVRTPTGRKVMDEDFGRSGPTRCRDASSISFMISKLR
jgi:hypothetical protein